MCTSRISAAVSAAGRQHSTSMTRFTRRDTNSGRWVCMCSTPIVIEKFSSVSVTISGTARYQFVAAGTSRPKASSPIQHTICASGPTFAGCSSLSTRRLKGVRSDDATGVRVLGRVELVVMGVLLGQRCRGR